MDKSFVLIGKGEGGRGKGEGVSIMSEWPSHYAAHRAKKDHVGNTLLRCSVLQLISDVMGNRQRHSIAKTAVLGRTARDRLAQGFAESAGLSYTAPCRVNNRPRTFTPRTKSLSTTNSTEMPETRALFSHGMSARAKTQFHAAQIKVRVSAPHCSTVYLFVWLPSRSQSHIQTQGRKKNRASHVLI